MASIEGTADMFGLSVLGANFKEVIRKEVDLTEAVVEHMKCKVRLRDYVDGKAAADYQPDPARILRDDQCMLGKWIHGPGRKLLGDNDKFNQLCVDHQHFHRIAAEMVSHAQAEDHSAADTVFRGEFQKISRKVMQALSELDQSVNR